MCDKVLNFIISEKVMYTRCQGALSLSRILRSQNKNAQTKEEGKCPGNNLSTYFDKKWPFIRNTPQDISDKDTFSLDQLAKLLKGKFHNVILELTELNQNIVKVDSRLSTIETKLDSVEKGK